MTAVLPHAPPEKSAPSKSKALDLSGSLKGAGQTGHESGSVKGKFQELLELAKPKSPTLPAVVSGDKAKLSPAKVGDHGAEKPREARKTEPKEGKAETDGASLVQASPQLKLEPALQHPKTGESDAASTAADKAKNLRADRRASNENGLLAAWNPGTLETSRQHGPLQGNAKGERSEDRQKVFVVDRRTEAKEKDKLKLPGAEGAAQQPVNLPSDLPGPLKGTEAKTDQVQVAFQSVTGKGSGQGSFDLQAQNTPVSPRDAASFQQYLVQQGYGQMVDQARIVLKDQNAGEIRMTLYPESLGKVKVSLNLSDNSLAGQIFVENQTVKDVFQANMDNLLQTFRDGGWNDLSLQVSVGGEHGPGNGGQPSHQAPQARDYGKQVAQTVSEGPTNRIGSWNDRQINLTA